MVTIVNILRSDPELLKSMGVLILTLLRDKANLQHITEYSNLLLFCL